MRTDASSASSASSLNTPTTNSTALDYKSPSADRQHHYLFKTTQGKHLALYFNGREKMTDVLDIAKKEMNAPDKVAVLVLGGKQVISDAQQYHHLTANGNKGLILAETAADLHLSNWWS